MSGRRLTLWAAAKLNLTLGVGERRADGYHEIRSVMQKISLYDTLSFAKADEICFTSDLKYLPNDERNLCVKAARLYFEAAGIDGGVDIRVRKAIPVGAGLGGGSADAACTLRALCALYRPLDRETLHALALSLGADVAFCLSEDTTCLCEGVGEVLTPIVRGGSAPIYLVLVKNDRKLSTASVYGAFDSMPARPIPSDEKVLAALQSGDAKLLSENLFNMLEQPVFAQKPALSDLLAEFAALGALGARMSGAGPTVYGVFDSQESALKAAAHFESAPFCRIATLL
ncbi:MAG: 4-(cytidine 5'-diphospho)-2-C-methyl-D-erythritol kinase [Clostridia bacterium]|nr:4-(cytidine 5'-diphospho)-2-C-methyl-D-erythritol kinase [Clostridia bacterium]